MGMVSISPNSVSARTIEVNPQVKSDHQTSVAQAAQDARKSEKTAQTDTVTISAQALKMADARDAAAKKASDEAEQQKAAQAEHKRADAARTYAQRNALKAYAAVSGDR